jgi:hypothetical protein
MTDDIFDSLGEITISSNEYIDTFEESNVIPIFHISPVETPSGSPCESPCGNGFDYFTESSFQVCITYQNCMCNSCVHARACSLGPPLDPELDCDCYLVMYLENLKKLDQDLNE